MLPKRSNKAITVSDFNISCLNINSNGEQLCIYLSSIIDTDSLEITSISFFKNLGNFASNKHLENENRHVATFSFFTQICVRDFIFSRLDAKWLNREIKYLHKIRNLQYLAVYCFVLHDFYHCMVVSE